jgi:hypothetical protein
MSRHCDNPDVFEVLMTYLPRALTYLYTIWVGSGALADTHIDQ